jgi:hypothetical protein
LRKREIVCEYQPYFVPEVQGQGFASPKAQHEQACSNDGPTIERWRDTWLSNIRQNKARFGSFKTHSVGNLFGKYLGRPMILAGSGPSLKFNAHELKKRGSIPLISCLHNFHFFEDQETPADYYVSLDAGPVTIEEVSEGGSKSADEYWALTKDRTLIAFIGSHPDLLKKWQGKIYLFNAPVPDQKYQDGLAEIETFNVWIGNGGNVLGSCLYISKAIFGSMTSIFIGADFSFGYDRRFHSWDSKYDKNMGHCVKAVDVFGNPVLSWQSYLNFREWFVYVTRTVPGLYINATEGGCFGSYPEGNIHTIRQMDLAKVIDMYHMGEHIKDQVLNPDLPGQEYKLLF